MRPRPFLTLLLLAAPAAAFSQTSPFLPDARLRALVNEISGDRAYEYVRYLSHYHRTDGSRDFFEGGRVPAGAAEAAGLEDVTLVRQKWDGHGWSCRVGEAWLARPAAGEARGLRRGGRSGSPTTAAPPT